MRRRGVALLRRLSSCSQPLHKQSELKSAANKETIIGRFYSNKVGMNERSYTLNHAPLCDGHCDPAYETRFPFSLAVAGGRLEVEGRRVKAPLRTLRRWLIGDRIAITGWHPWGAAARCLWQSDTEAMDSSMAGSL